MSTRRFDPVHILRRLRAHGVKFVLIGGLAAKAHGSPTMTVDIDVCYARDRDNLERLAALLGELGTVLRGAPPDLPFHPDRKTLERGDVLTFTTDFGDLDILGTPAGVSGFGELDANADEAELDDGLVVRVASLDDLIRMKRAAGRPKDRVELEILGALRDEIDLS
ncbi:MAG: nucleotidyl transferase AbiEii/AbiGii toxin family protein [Chloroflexi bacterium]|nr:nucleotidyl transferase AbiEii/AbiGii toxin family protein [Chloroflexota bacterium]